jgi:hypothetical protein
MALQALSYQRLEKTTDTAGEGVDRLSSAIEPRKAKFLVKRRDSKERKLDIP